MSARALLAGVIIGVTLVGVAIGRYPWLKMNRATIALVGATLLVALGVLTLDEAYRAVDWNTIVLLFGMMVLNVNLSFREYLKAGTPIATLSLLLGVAWLSW